MRSLIEKYQLAESNLLDAIEVLAKQQNIPFHQALLNSHVLSETNVAQLLAEEHDLPYINLGAQMIDQKSVASLPDLMMREHGVLAFKEDDDTVHVAVSDPSKREVMRAIYEHFQKYIEFYIAERGQIDRALPEQLDGGLEALPGDELVDALLELACENRATEIRFEPMHKGTQVRFRIYDLLYDILTLPPRIAREVAERIEVLSRYGDFAFERNEDRYVVHVSQSILYLLSPHVRPISLGALDVKQRHGMMLVASPSSSQRAATLQAIRRAVVDDAMIIDEISDKKTAASAIHLAMTGHLVLAGIKANDADDAKRRLLDMQVPPYAVTAAINVILC